MANLRPEPESLEEKYLEWESRLRRWKLGWAAPLVKHPCAIRMTTAWIAVVVMAAAVSWWLLVPAADWLAHHDVGSAKGALLQTARDAARGRLLTLGAGLFAGGVLLYTARNFGLSRQGQVTDRYTKAVEQFGSDKLDVRIGGIYALERIARDSRRDQSTVMEVLAAFVREHAEKWPLPPGHDGQDRERTARIDVQAALTAIGRRYATRDIGRIDLTDADLTGARWSRAVPAPEGCQLSTRYRYWQAGGGGQ
jgi:hypothetical protein